MNKFLLMGRMGDTIIVLPAFKYIFDKTGVRPIVVTSSRFGSIYEGCSYVDAIQVQDPTGTDYAKAQKYCKEKGIDARVLRWWMADGGDWSDIPLQAGDPTLVFGKNKWAVNFQMWPNYQTSLWDRTGVPIDLMNKLPLIFDQRNPEREQALIARVLKKNKKNLPVLLYNFNGHSSPFAAMPECQNVVSKWRDKFFIVDIGNMVAERIYDLIGLFEVSKLLVSIDTATLHLSAAVPNMKKIFFTNGYGWSSSVPNPVGKILDIKYEKAALPVRLKQLHNFIGSALNT